MAWRRPSHKPLSASVLVDLQTHLCVTRPQWVKWVDIFQHVWIFLCILDVAAANGIIKICWLIIYIPVYILSFVFFLAFMLSSMWWFTYQTNGSIQFIYFIRWFVYIYIYIYIYGWKQIMNGTSTGLPRPYLNHCCKINIFFSMSIVHQQCFPYMYTPRQK